ncbi:copper resistance protein B [Dyella jiangningensis]
MDMSAMPGMDHGAMPGMSMPTRQTDTPITPAPTPTKAAASSMPVAPTSSPSAVDPHAGMDHSTMPGMAPMASPAPADHDQSMSHDTMPGMDHGAMSSMGSGMTMGPMQGGHAPPDARSPDYSDGIAPSHMKGMDMRDNAPLGMLLIDQLEAFHSRDAHGQNWEAEGWYGNDANKLWVRTEGERSGGKLEDANLEAFWNRPVATYWSTQLGARQDFGQGPHRTWAAAGIQGLAPYWFELEATGYVGSNGRTAARLRAEYELLFTQRLILQPEAEMNLYGKDDPARRIGSGVSDVQFGLRLRYEIRRQFAPYIGINWVRRIGTTADYARQDHQPVLDRQIMAGIRLWF